jgi:hypothetical protein
MPVRRLGALGASASRGSERLETASTRARCGRSPSASTAERLTLAFVSDCGSANGVVRRDRWSSHAGVCATSSETPGRRRQRARRGPALGRSLLGGRGRVGWQAFVPGARAPTRGRSPSGGASSAGSRSTVRAYSRQGSCTNVLPSGRNRRPVVLETRTGSPGTDNPGHAADAPPSGCANRQHHRAAVARVRRRRRECASRGSPAPSGKFAK